MNVILSLIQKKKNQTKHQTHKVVAITSLQVGAERGTKLSVQRRVGVGVGGYMQPRSLPFLRCSLLSHQIPHWSRLLAVCFHRAAVG